MRIGFEDSRTFSYKRGRLRRLVTARVKYQVTDAKGQPAIDVAPMPPRALSGILENQRAAYRSRRGLHRRHPIEHGQRSRPAPVLLT